MAAPIGAPLAHAAGTIPLAMAVQVDSAGNQMPGCLLNFFVAGTVATPQNSFSDFGLSQNPLATVACDQSGRLPMFWLADGLIHVQLTDSAGSPVIDTTMQVLGPSSGGGGGGTTVDPTTIASTGDEKVRYGTGVIAGWVRENGLTLGNATSGATERANADTQNLFVYLYNTDPNLVVSGGRTGNALNDFNASKTIATADMRGRGNVALADMGNSATSIFTQSYALCNSNVTTLGAVCGLQNHTTEQVELPALTLPLNGAASGVTGNLTTPALGGPSAAVFGGVSSGGGGIDGFANAGFSELGISGTTTAAGTVGPLGSGAPFTIVPPIMLKTFYIKL